MKNHSVFKLYETYMIQIINDGDYKIKFYDSNTDKAQVIQLPKELMPTLKTLVDQVLESEGNI